MTKSNKSQIEREDILNYKRFNGSAIEIIPNMEGIKYRLANSKDIMYLKIFDQLKDTCACSIDAIANNDFGDIKIIRNSKDLARLTKDAYLIGGALSLNNSEFENLVGKDVLYLPRNKKGEKLGKFYTKEEAKDSEIWNFLARSNFILQKYVEKNFSELEKVGIKKGMAIQDNIYGDNFGTLRSIELSGLGGTFNIYGQNLNENSSRFIGIQNLKTFDEILQFSQKYVPEVDKEQFKQNLKAYYQGKNEK